MTEEVLTFGPHLYGAKLHINTWVELDPSLPVVVDCETDEQDNFVGAAITQDGINIYYNTEEPYLLKDIKLIGHNLKGDMKWLKGWGVEIKPEQLFYDTCLSSYVQNTTKETHSLKDLAREYLGMTWPTYSEMVGSGKAKQTLDKQSVEKVAAYCGMDCLATYRLWQYFQKKLNINEKRYLETIELPCARALLKMELLGVKIDLEYLQQLDKSFDITLTDLKQKISKQWIWDEPLNINSNAQIALLLTCQGSGVLPKTPTGKPKVDKATLEGLKHLPVVPLLLEYSKIEKLKGTYTESLLEKQKDGRIYASFNQLTRGERGQSIGISTGRLSSSNPNLQNIPARSDEGKLIRKAFIAGSGKVFIDADFSQIEYRLLAHFTKDKALLEAYRNNRDLHEETIKLITGKTVVTKQERELGKTLNFASIYGAQAKKIAAASKISEQEAQEFLDNYFKKLPAVTAWISRVKWEAHQKKGVFTLFKRWIPLPGIDSDNKYERMHWERVAVNSVIQGSAAEVMKLALAKLSDVGYNIVLTVHDEFLIETRDEDIVDSVKYILESLVPLDVPLVAEVGFGKDWQEAK